MEDVYTLLRCGLYKGDFDQQLKNFHKDLSQIPEGRVEITKYGSFDLDSSPHLFIVSYDQNVKKKFNVLLTITSRDSELSKNIADKLENETRFVLNVRHPKPKIVDYIRVNLNKIFLIIEKDPTRFRSQFQIIGQTPIFN